MIKALVVIVGLLIVVGAVAAAWFGVGVMDDMQKLDNQKTMQRSDNAYRRAGEAGEKKIADIEHQIEEKTTERNIWLGAAAGGMVLGLAMALLPLSRKRKVSGAGLVSAQNEAPSDS